MLRRIFATYRHAYRDLPAATWLLALAVLVNRMGSMVGPFFALYLAKEVGFSAVKAGFVLGLCGVGGVLGAYWGGRLSDRWGTWTVQVVSLLCAGVGLLVLGFLHSPRAIVGLMFVLAIISEAFRPANATAVAISCNPLDRPRAAVLRRLAVNAGMTVGPAVGGFLAVHDYLWLFLLDGGTCLLAALVLLLALPRWAPDTGSTRTAVEAGEASSGEPSVWEDRHFLIFLGCLLIFGLTFFQISSTFMFTLRDHFGFAEDTIGLLMAINPVVIVFAEMLLIDRVRHFSPLRVVAVGALLTGLGMGLLPWGQGFAWATFTLLLWTLGEMLASPVAEAFVAGRASDHNRGRYMGFYAQTFAASAVLAPVLGTWVYGTHGVKVLWFGVGMAGLVAAVGLWALSAKVTAAAQGESAIR